jgi:hypothetical protein
MQELLNIEQFYQRKFKKIKLNILGNWDKLLVLLESFDEWNLLNVIL